MSGEEERSTKTITTQDIFSRGSRNSFFVNMKLKDDVSVRDAQRDFSLFCLYYPMVLKSIQNRYPNGQLNCAFGISRVFWDRLFPNTQAPAELKTFEEISGESYKAPVTAGDFFLHIRAEYQDVCFEILKQYMHFLHPFLEPVYEVHGFNSSDGRDVIGFVNNNCQLKKSDLFKSVIIGDEDAAYRGGSYLFTQKYVHDMAGWDGLPVEEQERIIGRTKRENTDLTANEKYENAHNKVMRKAVKAGEKILRENVIFSNPSQNEYGTFFISYSRSFEIVERMLSRMFGSRNSEQYDKLLEYSTPVTGNLFFVPSVDLIDDFGKGKLK